MAYSSRAQLYQLGLRSAALADVPTADQDEALDGAADFIDSYLGGRFTLPLLTWEKDLVRANAIIASWDLLTVRGFGMNEESDEIAETRYDQIVKWLEGIAAGDITPVVTDSTATIEAGTPQVWSDEERGY